MKDKETNRGCGIGCVTGLVFYTIGIIILLLIVYREPSIPIERDAVGYIIEHVDEFRDEINAMGYEVRVAYTWADIWKEKYEEDERFNKQKKLGTEDRGILILFTDREEYVFDVGFDYCDINLKDGNKIYMSKGYSYEDEVLDLKDRWFSHPIYVSISGKDVENRKHTSNYYSTNFIEYSDGIKGEIVSDMTIKEYISAEELRAIYERCIGLQEKLVELYKAKKG